MKAERLKFFSVLAVAVLLTFASYELIQKYVTEQTNKEIMEHQEQQIDVLVSSKSVFAGGIIEDVMLAKRSYPQHLVQDSWLRPEDAALIIGLAAARYIEKGEPLSPDTLMPVVASTFSQTLAADSYAVTSMISKPQLHNGLVQIGDVVTLVTASFDTSEQSIVLPNIKVLALDYYDNPKQLAVTNHDYLPSTITFEFTQEQALIFEQMRRQSFAVWLQNPTSRFPPINPKHAVLIHYLKVDKEVENVFDF